jgi:hypothetical protein
MAETILWEYRVAVTGGLISEIKDADLAVLLNEWGSEGWELVSAVPLTNTSKLRLVAKRPIQPSTRRKRSWPAS